MHNVDGSGHISVCRTDFVGGLLSVAQVKLVRHYALTKFVYYDEFVVEETEACQCSWVTRLLRD